LKSFRFAPLAGAHHRATQLLSRFSVQVDRRST